jgi:hypothetical protein
MAISESIKQDSQLPRGADGRFLKSSLSLENRFWKNVDMRSPDECWLWTGQINHNGYGNCYIYKKNSRQSIFKLAHRVSYCIAHSLDLADIKDWYILHSCDTPLCVNPNHLRAGSQKDNINDMISRNRQNWLRCEQKACAKLTASDIPKIRELIAQGKYNTDIAKIFNVDDTVISRIRTGNAWIGY